MNIGTQNKWILILLVRISRYISNSCCKSKLCYGIIPLNFMLNARFAFSICFSLDLLYYHIVLNIRRLLIRILYRKWHLFLSPISYYIVFRRILLTLHLFEIIFYLFWTVLITLYNSSVLLSCCYIFYLHIRLIGSFKLVLFNDDLLLFIFLAVNIINYDFIIIFFLFFL